MREKLTEMTEILLYCMTIVNQSKQAPNDDSLLNTLKTLFRLSKVVLDL